MEIPAVLGETNAATAPGVSAPSTAKQRGCLGEGICAQPLVHCGRRQASRGIGAPPAWGTAASDASGV